MEFNVVENDRLLREDLLFRDSTRNMTVQRDKIYKRAVARYHNAGDWVLQKNQVSRQEPSRKLDAGWDGPYRVRRPMTTGHKF